MRPTWGPPGSCRPQMGPMLAHEPCSQASHALEQPAIYTTGWSRTSFVIWPGCTSHECVRMSDLDAQGYCIISHERLRLLGPVVTKSETEIISNDKNCRRLRSSCNQSGTLLVQNEVWSFLKYVDFVICWKVFHIQKHWRLNQRGHSRPTITHTKIRNICLLINISPICCEGTIIVYC